MFVIPLHVCVCIHVHIKYMLTLKIRMTIVVQCSSVILSILVSLFVLFSLPIVNEIFSFYCSVIRSISGHKAAICSLDFHRFGDILASGSMDTNLKV